MTGWSTNHDGVAIEVAVIGGEAGEDQLDVQVAVEDRGEPALERLLAALRHATSQAELLAHGVAGAYRVEDLLAVDAAVVDDDEARAERWLRRRLSKETAVQVRPRDGRARARATFARRGARPTSQRKVYTRSGDKIRVEAFELHVVEHCNLRCAHCCNMSPYLAERTLTVAEIEAMCRTMAAHLQVDVFKIMGGEPLLHPQITEVLHAIRRSGISETIRLFTNGLRLHAMDDAFWAALDELTISHYASAPVRPAHLAAARARARAFDVVLNVKPVGEFSEVMRLAREPDDATVGATYERCWLRHRCLVVRRGKFYMCTRAAYAEEFHRDIAHGAYADDREAALAGDGVPLDAPDLGAALLAYLNRAEPLVSCRFCHGGDGPVAAHTQLSRADVRAGRLHPLRVRET
ncbi:4Fe-4S single cluster domain-containing protein [Nannocystis exedens]|uniref:4Fe-4S single cluster domain-containing protein n=1 Tax=Nannocystis exedens TaxID=54 RepID=A0A1I2IFA4_9BACT|nr:radical SAM protein [Nannocystis exedens]PCC73662.1 molybdenum cofactor biosynthesis protein A [Nannocystis exedens]SFF40995.1 4Fe-4S single cluster domain-containing protein [Nannocystis exedens]